MINFFKKGNGPHIAGPSPFCLLLLMASGFMIFFIRAMLRVLK